MNCNPIDVNTFVRMFLTVGAIYDREGNPGFIYVPGHYDIEYMIEDTGYKNRALMFWLKVARCIYRLYINSINRYSNWSKLKYTKSDLNIDYYRTELEEDGLCSDYLFPRRFSVEIYSVIYMLDQVINNILEGSYHQKGIFKWIMALRIDIASFYFKLYSIEKQRVEPRGPIFKCKDLKPENIARLFLTLGDIFSNENNPCYSYMEYVGETKRQSDKRYNYYMNVGSTFWLKMARCVYRRYVIIETVNDLGKESQFLHVDFDFDRYEENYKATKENGYNGRLYIRPFDTLRRVERIICEYDSITYLFSRNKMTGNETLRWIKSIREDLLRYFFIMSSENLSQLKIQKEKLLER